MHTKLLLAAAREASSALLHRAAHYLHTRRLASELEGQAASWHLLHALYCSGDNPAGNNLAGAADAGGRQTLREMTAALVNSNTQLRRCGSGSKGCAACQVLATVLYMRNTCARAAVCEAQCT